MKRTLLLFAVVGLASASAMAQGPPLADGLIAGANDPFGADAGSMPAASDRGGGRDIVHRSVPVNERMLN